MELRDPGPPALRRAAHRLAGAVALAGPVVVGFASGGFTDEARLVALLVAAVTVALWAATGPGPLPRGGPAWLALLGLAGYCGWVALSQEWAPLADTARADVQRVLLYLAALALAATVWRPRGAARAVEPVVALGALVVVGYGLLGRLLPGIVHAGGSLLAGARLAEPLTYWNSEGLLAAIGLVLCARLTGDRTRAGGVRVAAAAASAPLGAALYLTFSRGALAALAGALLVLLALAPTWSQLRGVVLSAEAAAGAIAACAAFPGVNDLAGTLGEREADGAIALAILLVVALLAAAIAAWALRVEADARTRMGRLPLPRRAGSVAGVLAIALLLVPILAEGSAAQGTAPRFGETTSRLTTLGSHRLSYWRVAGTAFADHPLRGIGTGGYRVAWLRHRDIDEHVRDAHSLYLETLAELGLVGLALLAALFAGVAWAARRVALADPALAAGPIAALAAWALHAGVDWDWELPGVTLPAIVLAGMLLARAAAPRERDASLEPDAGC